MTRTRFGLALLCLVFAALAMPALANAEAPKAGDAPLHVTYYFLPG